MSQTLRYRQQVVDFRARLNNILNGAGPARGRIPIDSTGNRSRAVPFSSTEQAMTLYGKRRYESAARVFALFEIARGHLRPGLATQHLNAVPHGAVWQAFRGTRRRNACHTCPTHLMINGQLPTLITNNRGLQRHIIVEFADCMLMPRSINNLDSAVDDLMGRAAFANAAESVLNDSRVTWRDGLRTYRERMRTVVGDGFEILTQPGGSDFQSGNAQEQERLDMLIAYYEGLFLHSENEIQMANFVDQVRQEMGLP